MPLDRNLSIYVTERPCTQIDAEEAQWFWHHSFLSLVDRTGCEDGDVKSEQVLEELHYYNSQGWRMVPVQKPMQRDEKEFSTLKFAAVDTADELKIMTQWNRALSFALDVKALQLDFDLDYMDGPKSNNCRAGVNETLSFMGYEFKRCQGVEAAGLESTVISERLSLRFSNVVDAKDLNEAWMFHAYLSDRLASGENHYHKTYEL